ncbi:three-deoxy-D-manno-octulosonic-acid transferase domain-containing protein [Galbibacter marinus]|uniref:3-deoxy-D-manno-octulosonic acid transferase n=1 Tax=Galbibacter marinus TaxID=555500 RepID=K2PNS4_9FLAO|nr:glycosyltransferase N-terminal domain-containing protein [Galbibacter marinus]EKF54180.1 three-deoxy-D-manno-octulosonic-acid transferase domain-containing protein [Galbibacter marinus]
MYFLYNIVVHIVSGLLFVVALFSDKIRRFVHGRKGTFDYLQTQLNKENPLIWFHTASLGEFEQGLPLIEQCKREYPNYKILVTFFSPSGYEVKKNTKAADLVCYLPLDTKGNMQRFIELADPKLAIFVKYEFWPNTLKLLQKRHIPTLLVSGIFRPDQIFFKSYGSFMTHSLKSFTHFFVQNEQSKSLLNSINFQNVTVSGDTRYDRVMEILDRDNSLDFMEEFIENSFCLVAGSTWIEDQEILVDYINNTARENLKVVIAPHKIEGDQIKKLKNSIKKNVVLYSELDQEIIGQAKVLIVDTVGLLTRIYSYADIAYVGGGMGSTGLHNTLEPAVFGIPVLIGKHYRGFIEAEKLVELGGIESISTKGEFFNKLNFLLDNKEIIKDKGRINKKYIEKKTGAKIQIGNYIRKLLKDSSAG